MSHEEDQSSEEEIVKVPIAKVEPAAVTAQPVLKVKDDDSDEEDDDLTGWNN
jgi:hypothetical protein